MEAILSSEEQSSRSHEELMAGLVVSRSRKTRDPSAFLQWSVAPPPPQVHTTNTAPSPTVTNATTTGSNNTNTNSNVNSNWGLPRSASLPTRFNVEQDTTGRTSANRALPLLAPPQVHKKKSYHEQVGAFNYGPVFEEDQPRARAVRKFTKGDKLNEQTKKFEKKQLTSKANVQHELWRTSSSPISTGAGNWNRLARSGSCSVACNTPEDEKYAGPAYSKSPPPCSLPFPKFSVHQPARAFSNNTTDHSSSTTKLPGGSSSSSGLESPSKQISCNCWDTSFATRDLKRILNLDQQVVT